MKIQLSQLLAKWGIQSPEQLAPDERETFKQWESILSKELTVNSIAEFCDSQIKAIEFRWDQSDTPEQSKAELIPYHTCYRKMAALIRAPQTERENLEKHLRELLNS